MVHFGVIPAISGHLNPMAALGRELVARGHRVTFFHVPEMKAKVLAEAVEFRPLGSTGDELERYKARVGRLPKLGLGTIAEIRRNVPFTVPLILESAPAALEAAGVEALLTDQVEPAAGSVAEALGLPFVSLCSAVPINCDPQVPPDFLDWSYQDAWWARLRNRLAYRLRNYALNPTTEALNVFRSRHGLRPVRRPEDTFSSLAQITQLPAELDFPRTELPRCFHYTGPILGPRPRPVDFPWQRLDPAKPLVYASLGTLQNRRPQAFRTIAQACEGLGVQLVLSLGGGGRVEDYPDLPAETIVVPYAPQLDLLDRAQLTITHAGLNTTMESLSRAVPMVAIPVTTDQPGVAARVHWCGAGEVVPMAKLDVLRLRTAIVRVLETPTYRQNAGRLKAAIARAGGVRRAADIVEAAIAPRKPVPLRLEPS